MTVPGCSCAPRRVAGNVQVVHTNGLALLFQHRTDGPVVLRGFGAIGQDIETAAEVLDGGQVLAGTCAFLRAVQEFSQGDGRNRHAAGVGVESGQYLDRPPLQYVDDDVGVQQVAQHQSASRSGWSWLARSAMKSSLTTGPSRKKLSQV